MPKVIQESPAIPTDVPRSREEEKALKPKKKGSKKPSVLKRLKEKVSPSKKEPSKKGK